VFLRDMGCLRNICVNTLHKGDSIFTNNNNNNNNNNNYYYYYLTASGLSSDGSGYYAYALMLNKDLRNLSPEGYK
jgi:hypothetical protein